MGGNGGHPLLQPTVGAAVGRAAAPFAGVTDHDEHVKKRAKQNLKPSHGTLCGTVCRSRVDQPSVEGPEPRRAQTI